MEVEKIATLVETRGRVEHVVALVKNERLVARAIEVDGVEIGAEASRLVGLPGPREDDRLTRWMKRRRRRRALWGKIDDPSERVTAAVEREKTGRVREDERGLQPDARARRRRRGRRRAGRDQRGAQHDAHVCDAVHHTITSPAVFT